MSFKSTLARVVLILSSALFSTQTMAAGALAIDRVQGAQYGWAQGYPSIVEAERSALNECGSGCMIVLTYSKGCGAFAADQMGGSNATGWGTAPTGSGAQSRAVFECQSRGGRSCIVRAWSCN